MAELAAMEAIKGRWMMGTAALDAAPAAWREALKGDPAAELALLALVGQAMQVTLAPQPDGILKPVPALPRLVLPPLPERLRPDFRRLLTLRRMPADLVACLLHLLAMRGATVHPADLMPTRFEGLPEPYAAWADWDNGAVFAPSSEQLTAETWDSWPPAERLPALRVLRQDAPARARDLIAAKAREVTADQRLRLVTILEAGLAPDDIPILESLKEDRSAKVRNLATILLARLGRRSDRDEDAAELAGFFTLKQGRLRGARLSTRPLKTDAQRARRADLMQQVSLAGLAQALDTEPETLVERFKLSGGPLTRDFLTMVAQTGADGAVEVARSRAMEAGLSAADAAPLVPRLSVDARRAFFPGFLSQPAASLLSWLDWGAGLWGTLPAATLASAEAVGDLIERAGEQFREASNRTDPVLAEGLFCLGVLADAPAAGRLVQRFVAAGMSAADPLLGVLAFNAVLIPDTVAVPKGNPL
jgi:hypothetical protein